MMADYPEIFSYPPSRRRIHVREEFIGICAFAPTPLCAAMLLSVFERWTQFRIEERRKIANANADRGANAPLPHLWVFMSAQQLYREILFSYGMRTIQLNLQWLVDQKYLSRRNNPDKGWDRTYQYRLRFAHIQAALNIYAEFELYFDPPKSRAIAQNCVMDSAKMHNALRKTAQALPRSSSRSSARRKAPPREKQPSAPTITPDEQLRLDIEGTDEYQAYREAHLDAFISIAALTQKRAKEYQPIIDQLRAEDIPPHAIKDYVRRRLEQRGEYAFSWLVEDIERMRPEPEHRQPPVVVAPDPATLPRLTPEEMAEVRRLSEEFRQQQRELAEAQDRD